MEAHGTAGSWIALPTKAGLKRCGKSCRLRWLNYLRPNIKHGGFTEEEDGVIFSLYNQYGSRWSAIASQLPGTTDNDLKNHWNTKLKKKRLLSGNTKHQTKVDVNYLHSDLLLPHAPETGSHPIASSSASQPLRTLTTLPEFTEIIDHRPFPDFTGLDLSELHVPTPSSSSFSNPSSVAVSRHVSLVSGGGDGGDEWGLMEDSGGDLPQSLVYGLLFQEKNGELCL